MGEDSSGHAALGTARSVAKPVDDPAQNPDSAAGCRGDGVDEAAHAHLQKRTQMSKSEVVICSMYLEPLLSWIK